MADAPTQAEGDEAQSTQSTFKAQSTQEDGSGAPCTVCHRAFTLTNTGLVRVHVGNQCPGSQAPPDASYMCYLASHSGANPPLFNDKAQPIPSTYPSESNPQYLPLKPAAVRILRRIPCACWELTAKRLASMVEGIVTDPDNLLAWNRLFRFTSRCL